MIWKVKEKAQTQQRGKERGEDEVQIIKKRKRKNKKPGVGGNSPADLKSKRKGSLGVGGVRRTTSRQDQPEAKTKFALNGEESYRL